MTKILIGILCIVATTATLGTLAGIIFKHRKGPYL